MFDDHTIAVLVPAYNEGRQIAGVLTGMPAWVDHVVVVDDASTDDTAEVVAAHALHDPRVHLFRNAENQGVGGALCVAYTWARDAGVDIAVTVDGDGQMDPADMSALIEPIVAGRADYTKGNRLTRPSDVRAIPKIRLFGNVGLSVMTKIATGYWSLADSQSGYSAAGRHALEHIEWDRVYKRYGRPNDVLVHASIAGCRAADVPIRSLYGVGEQSTMKVAKVTFSIGWLLFRRFWRRMFMKHVLIDFHPMIFLYAYALIAGIVSAALLPRMLFVLSDSGEFPKLASYAFVISSVTAVNALFLAFYMDLQAHRDVSLPLQTPAGVRSRPTTVIPTQRGASSSTTGVGEPSSTRAASG